MGTTPFVILLPPSEGKEGGGTESKPWSAESGVFGKHVGAQRHRVAAELKKAKGGDGKLLGVKGTHLEHAQAHNRRLVGSPTLPAWQRYTGVVWGHLDLASFPSATRTSCIKRIFIPSGLAGIVRGDDPLPDYRLKMGARLAPLGLMSTWWRHDVSQALSQHIKKIPVIDLLPQEHKAALDWSLFPTAVHVDLVSKKGAVVGGHNAKAAKGLLARHLLLNSQQSLAELLSSFSHPDYSAKETS